MKKRSKNRVAGLRYIALLCTVLCCMIGTAAAQYTPLRDPNVYRCHTNACNKIALTFDDGPHEKYTAQILTILERYGAKATFFVVGSNAAAYPELLQRAHAAGCEIGNHTMEHVALGQIEMQRLQHQVLRCEQIIEEICDQRPVWFRPPQGYCTAQISSLADALDYRVALWRIDTEDWKHRSTEAICQTVLSQIQSGDIVLLHDFIGGESHTVQAVERLVPALQQRGFVLVTLSELVGTN